MASLHEILHIPFTKDRGCALTSKSKISKLGVVGKLTLLTIISLFNISNFLEDILDLDCDFLVVDSVVVVVVVALVCFELDSVTVAAVRGSEFDEDADSIWATSPPTSVLITEDEDDDEFKAFVNFSLICSLKVLSLNTSALNLNDMILDLCL